MRSTSATMRSVSSQISRVSSRPAASASCSSSCAAPRMPDSGFLTSCASIAAIAVTERAALRWVELAVDLVGDRALVQGQDQQVRRFPGQRAPGSSPSGCRSRGAFERHVVFRRSCRRCARPRRPARRAGCAAATKSASALPRSAAAPRPKNCSAAGLTRRIVAAAVDDDDRVGKRGEHRGGLGWARQPARLAAAPPERRHDHAACALDKRLVERADQRPAPAPGRRSG